MWDIFNQGSILLSSKPKEALSIDQKAYSEGDAKFIISQVEEIGFDHFWSCYEELLAELKELRKREGAALATLLVTDINRQESLLLADASRDILDRIQFPELKAQAFDIGEMVSRKKQVVPYLTEILRT